MPATIQETRVTITEVGSGPQILVNTIVRLTTAAGTSDLAIKMGSADLALTPAQETSLGNIMTAIRNRAIDKVKAALVIP